MTTISGRARSRLSSLAGSPSTVLIVATLATVLFGLVMTLSASTVISLQQNGSPYTIFFRQVLWIAVGLVALGAAMYTGPERWRRVAVPLLGLSLVLLALVLVPGVGITVFGATRWIGVGLIQFQPSELAKIALVLACAVTIEAKHAKFDDHLQMLVPIVFPMLAVTSLLVLLEPDLGTTLTMAATVIGILVLGGARLRHLAWIAGIGILLTTVLGFAASYRRARLLSFLDPWADTSATGYQVIQSLIAVGSGGPGGLGLGASRQKWSFLPNAHTDFIYSIISEELGLIGSLVVLALLVVIVLACLRTARLATTTFGSVVAGGVGIWIGVQSFLNIGAVTGMLPITGVPLPLISVGGSNAVVSMFAIGIVIAIGRDGERSARKAKREFRRADHAI